MREIGESLIDMYPLCVSAVPFLVKGGMNMIKGRDASGELYAGKLMLAVPLVVVAAGYICKFIGGM